MIMTTLGTPSSLEAQHRIEDWFRRGYVFFSDVITQSTHLIRVEEAFARPVKPRPTQR
ncbi:MAG: hypothetical protein P1P84_19280 [Deferrisomatales bacterium]|nr:hypothetical protein [Deferrisomatales bacterium]